MLNKLVYKLLFLFLYFSAGIESRNGLQATVLQLKSEYVQISVQSLQPSEGSKQHFKLLNFKKKKLRAKGTEIVETLVKPLLSSPYRYFSFSRQTESSSVLILRCKVNFERGPPLSLLAA